MKSLLFKFGLLASMALFAVACGGGGEGEPEPIELSAPMPSIDVQGAMVTITWPAVQFAGGYFYECYKNGALTSSSSTNVPSYTYRMTDGANYGFRVKATADASGMYLDSPWSPTLQSQLGKLPMTSAQVVSGSLKTTEAKIVWTKINQAVGYHYQLLEGSTVKQEADLTVTEVIFTDLKPGTDYKFKVKSISDGSLLDSEYSSVLSFRTLSAIALATPSNVRAVPVGTTANFVWDVVEKAASYQYELYYGSEQSAYKSGNTTKTDLLLEDLKLGDYRFRVKAVAPANDETLLDSEYSQAVTFSLNGQQIDLGIPTSELDGVIRAFPGAEGGGMYTTGGRGGKVIHVTNLNDSGAGSLRAALNESGARTIVFDVCGTIQLKSQLSIKNGDVTIAGQTAPGEGITLRDYTVYVGANNVIIRFIRFRMGDETKQENDATWGRYQQDIIIDHCSMSWCTDECGSFYANKNFTMQWCLLGESLNESVHGKGSHGYGGIWGGKNASFHHNLLTCHKSRNPRFCHPQVYSSYVTTHRGNVDYRNNVVYNWGDNSSYGGEDLHINMVGNYYKPGPASKQRNYFLDANGYYSSGNTQYKYPRLYVEGNYHAGSYATALNSDNWQGIYWHDQSNATQHAAGDAPGAKLNAPLPIKQNDSKVCHTSTHSAANAYARVLDHVGASLRRDAVDKRLVDDARNGKATYSNGGNGSKNGIIDSQSAVGGWPTLTATSEEIARATTDTDGDHIPDYYEQLMGLDKTKADATEKTLDPQGLYSNFEMYLHLLVKEITTAQLAGSSYVSLQ